MDVKMAIEMLIQHYSKQAVYNYQRRIAQNMPIEVLKAYVRGTQCFGKSIAKILCFLEAGIKARHDVLDERLREGA